MTRSVAVRCLLVFILKIKKISKKKILKKLILKDCSKNWIIKKLTRSVAKDLLTSFNLKIFLKNQKLKNKLKKFGKIGQYVDKI